MLAACKALTGRCDNRSIPAEHDGRSQPNTASWSLSNKVGWQSLGISVPLFKFWCWHADPKAGHQIGSHGMMPKRSHGTQCSRPNPLL